MDGADKPLRESSLGDAFSALAEAVRQTYAPLFEFFDEVGYYEPLPATKKPLIHNGRKPRK
ncbi:hypothetical protein ARTSIC4J27_262 [Pseudarthrobacter siccitolerans]|uniref:Uncharacterized protein n=1 Tax=Pseudarthrobacter siccitolerans TaxID=861266 RepID=A0A024GX44_9MICC|nr:hypothetical protein [Pseudarthrobacter siccitolerans]CCQ44338.1 hypothetical protein ARTSIC4J27_262 [Pseudarthrobacter siccitolerans]